MMSPALVGFAAALLSGIGMGIFQLWHGKAHTMPGAARTNVVLLAVALPVTALLVLPGGNALAELRGLPQTTLTHAMLWFAAAGIMHFTFGVNLLSLSQRVVGAGRSSGLLATGPLFAAILGLVLFDERITLPIAAGVVLVVTGLILVARA